MAAGAHMSMDSSRTVASLVQPSGEFFRKILESTKDLFDEVNWSFSNSGIQMNVVDEEKIVTCHMFLWADRFGDSYSYTPIELDMEDEDAEIVDNAGISLVTIAKVIKQMPAKATSFGIRAQMVNIQDMDSMRLYIEYHNEKKDQLNEHEFKIMDFDDNDAEYNRDAPFDYKVIMPSDDLKDICNVIKATESKTIRINIHPDRIEFTSGKESEGICRSRIIRRPDGGSIKMQGVSSGVGAGFSGSLLLSKMEKLVKASGLSPEVEILFRNRRNAHGQIEPREVEFQYQFHSGELIFILQTKSESDEVDIA